MLDLGLFGRGILNPDSAAVAHGFFQAIRLPEDLVLSGFGYSIHFEIKSRLWQGRPGDLRK
jgi:hypothetical protein